MVEMIGSIVVRIWSIRSRSGFDDQKLAEDRIPDEEEENDDAVIVWQTAAASERRMKWTENGERIQCDQIWTE